VVVPVEITDGMLNLDFITLEDNAKLSGMEIRRSVTGINMTLPGKIPDNYILFQNYPNPFNPVTHIQYGLPEESHVKITVYNILGEVTAVLIDEKMNAGFHSVYFNADKYPAGIYFYQIVTDKFQTVRKMILLK
jgi:hypothetical protein